MKPSAGMVLGLVICFHAGLLFLVLPSKPVQPDIITSPAIAGVLVQMPSAEEPKAAQKKLAPVPEPKPVVAAKKVKIPAPPEKPAVSEAEEMAVAVEHSADARQQISPIVAPRVDATRRSNPAPVYPRSALRRQQQGKVILEVLIQTDGAVAEVRLKQSSGFKRLDRSAIKAVKRWRYIAAQQSGKAIEYWYQQAIVFSLRQ
ncbi:MAG: TonB family protein [Gammaproteobacteria bacterium]|nr:TonB family protein [Gammaproteobacteria bacterium]